MSLTRLTAAIALSLLGAFANAASAAPHEEMPPVLGGIQQPYDLVPFDPQAYVEATDFEQPYTNAEQPSDAGGPYEDCGQPIPGCCDVCGERSNCCCDVNYRSGWTLALDASALQSHMASRDVDAWPEGL